MVLGIVSKFFSRGQQSVYNGGATTGLCFQIRFKLSNFNFSNFESLPNSANTQLVVIVSRE